MKYLGLGSITSRCSGREPGLLPGGLGGGNRAYHLCNPVGICPKANALISVVFCLTPLSPFVLLILCYISYTVDNVQGSVSLSKNRFRHAGRTSLRFLPGALVSNVADISVKPRLNDRNISTQHISTLLDAACCARVGHPVATCWVLLAQI